MYEGMPLSQLETAEKIPQGSSIPVVMGDGAGVKRVTKETLVEETGKALKVGNLEELETENKENIVAAINEVKQSGGGGASVDILDSKEEIEANTEQGKVAGALAMKEMFTELNDNLAQHPEWVRDSSTGEITGYRFGGADPVFPFNKIKNCDFVWVDGKNITVPRNCFCALIASNRTDFTVSYNGNTYQSATYNRTIRAVPVTESLKAGDILECSTTFEAYCFYFY